jgi:hypothetical protein
MGLQYGPPTMAAEDLRLLELLLRRFLATHSHLDPELPAAEILEQLTRSNTLRDFPLK